MFKMLNKKAKREYTKKVKIASPQSCYNYAHSTDEGAEWLPLDSGIVGGLFLSYNSTPVPIPGGGR